MANQEHLDIIKQGVKAWNQWRIKHADIQPGLSTADLSSHLGRTDLHEANLSNADLSNANFRGPSVGADLSSANLSSANLSGANLSRADLSNANLSNANLSNANLDNANLDNANLDNTDLSRVGLWEANLSNANLSNANLSNVNLHYAIFSGASFSGATFNRTTLDYAHLRGANLSGADLTGQDLSIRRDHNSYSTELREADLSGANLSGANLTDQDLSNKNLSGAILKGALLNGVNLSGADLSGANLAGQDLSNKNLTGADLSGANLSRTLIVGTNFTNATLNDCAIYGIAAWDVQLENASQRNLVITPEGEAIITVDNLKVAQFIYLMLNNKEIREVINSLTTKSVLILGRFTSERKTVLDALREELRKQNYLPILFDFEKPASRNLTETVRTLAHLSRFIIADLTDPSSIPQELQAIVPTLAVPVQPVLYEGKREYAMFVDFLKTYHWVLPTHYYTDQTHLLATLKEQIIEPAEQKAQELEKR